MGGKLLAIARAGKRRAMTEGEFRGGYDVVGHEEVPIPSMRLDHDFSKPADPTLGMPVTAWSVDFAGAGVVSTAEVFGAGGGIVVVGGGGWGEERGGKESLDGGMMVEHDEGGPRVDDVFSKMNEFFTVVDER